MDILNFISWIRGGRKFTNVDPNTTLLPVGVRDNRRDDKYLAGGISVTDFGNDLGVGIEIPKLIARTVNGDVVFSLDFYQSDAWKALNPRIFLYRARKKRRIFKAGSATINKPAGFVHPTNTAGTQPGGRWWTGEQRIMQSTSSAPDPLIRHTEFSLLTTVPYQSFNLADLSPYEWVEYRDVNANTIRQSTASDFPIIDTAAGNDTGSNGFYVKFFNAKVSTMFPPAVRATSGGGMKRTFRFAIVIDNPNATPDAPYLIGPMSDNVDLKFNWDQFSGLVSLTFTTAYVNKTTASV
jgi:hypothetical protein